MCIPDGCDRKKRVSMGCRRHRGLFAEILSGRRRRDRNWFVDGNHCLDSINPKYETLSLTTTGKGGCWGTSPLFLEQWRRNKEESLICHCRYLRSPFLVGRPSTCVKVSCTGCLKSWRGGAGVGVGRGPAKDSFVIKFKSSSLYFNDDCRISVRNMWIVNFTCTPWHGPPSPCAGRKPHSTCHQFPSKPLLTPLSLFEMMHFWHAAC